MRRSPGLQSFCRSTPLLDRKPGQLSGGQRQRVAMGRALVRDPLLFLFDEPLSNLDAQLRAEMRMEIKQLHQRLGSTIVYVTHDQIEAMTLATRIAVMRQGVVQQFGDPETVYNRPANLFVARFMGAPPMNTLSARLEATSGGTCGRHRTRRGGGPASRASGGRKLDWPRGCARHSAGMHRRADTTFRRRARRCSHHCCSGGNARADWSGDHRCPASWR